MMMMLFFFLRKTGTAQQKQALCMLCSMLRGSIMVQGCLVAQDLAEATNSKMEHEI